MFPVAGSPAGDDHAMRRGGTSLSYTLNRCSQISLPESAFRHRTRSCMESPSPEELKRKRRPPMMIGVDLPPYGAFQRRPSPFGDHLTGSPVSGDVPSRAGPRQSGQSLPDGERPASVVTPSNSG